MSRTMYQRHLPVAGDPAEVAAGRVELARLYGLEMSLQGQLRAGKKRVQALARELKSAQDDRRRQDGAVVAAMLSEASAFAVADAGQASARRRHSGRWLASDGWKRLANDVGCDACCENLLLLANLLDDLQPRQRMVTEAVYGIGAERQTFKWCASWMPSSSGLVGVSVGRVSQLRAAAVRNLRAMAFEMVNAAATGCDVEVPCRSAADEVGNATSTQ